MKPGCKVCSKARSFLPTPMRERLEKIERDRLARQATKLPGGGYQPIGHRPEIPNPPPRKP